MNQLRCPRCTKGTLLTDHNTGERFCENCGFVIVERSEMMDSEGVWVVKKDGNVHSSRTGTPTSLAVYDMGLSTIIDSSNRDASGKPLSTTMRSTIDRLRIWDHRSRVYRNTARHLAQAFIEIDAVKHKLALPDSVLEKTAYIYRKALEMNLMQGRSISGVVAAALYAACREMETTRTLNDISDATNVKRNDVARCYRKLLREMDLKIPVVSPTKCLGRIASTCNLSEKVKRTALTILKKAEDLGISEGKDPMSMAGSALYLSSIINGENKRQKDIADASGMTEVTIRNRYRALQKDLNL